MKRRSFIAMLGGAVAGWSFDAHAQQPLPVIGFLGVRTAVRVRKKRLELQAHSRFRIRSGYGLPVATGAVS
jgi:hypothetical protein